MTTVGNDQSHFWMEEQHDGDGALRLSLIGELDLAVADQLAARLRELEKRGGPVLLDLGQLEFIDSSGLRELVVAISSSRSNGQQLHIGRELTNSVRRVIEVVGLTSHFWPDGR